MLARIGNHADMKGVLALQELNLYSNLSEKDREKGFVTTPFTTDQINRIIIERGLFVVEDKSQIIAYAFAGSWSYFMQWDIFSFMVSRFPTLTFNGRSITTANSFQYGPVCIDANYRGKNVLNLIFEEMRIEMIKKYPVSITFINKVNGRSVTAHTKKLGWKIIDEFEFNKNTYLGLAFEMENSVLDN